jgi:superfamily II DNA or RNA helicase
MEVEVLKKQFREFRDVLWELLSEASEKTDYMGVAEIRPLILFFKKILRTREIDLRADFIDDIGHFFDPGSAVFILELFSELASFSHDSIQNLVGMTKRLKEKYGEKTLNKIINFPVVLLKPWIHQEKAFNHWCKNGHRGVIEMATATGKTLVGLMAIQKLAAEKEKENSKGRKKGRVLIISHSRAILNQWKYEVIDKLGFLANYSDYKTPVSCDYVKIEFETIQSLIRKNGITRVDLLIADEVHHIAAPEFRNVFMKVGFRWFMGLSASPDEGERARIFENMRMPVVFRYGLRDAINDGVLPEFNWYVHPVFISERELKEFSEISEMIRKGFFSILEDEETDEFLRKLGEDKELITNLNDFVRIIEKARYNKIEIPENWKKLALLITQRRWLIHRSIPKIEEAIDMAKEYYSQGKKVIVFTMDIESCNHISKKLSEELDDVFVIHSEISNPFEVLSAFKQKRSGILVGARMLDEGIDIPDAEIGLNVAASKTKIQLVQRLGRILRKYGDKKPIFHHFVGVPSERNFLEFEDPFWMLDEISWVMDTALNLGFNVSVIEQERIKDILKQSEAKVRQSYNLKPFTLPSYGVIKLDRILSQFGDGALTEMVNLLGEFPEDKQITNEEWLEILNKCRGDKDGISNIKGHWWILILGDRNPVKIRKLLYNAI